MVFPGFFHVFSMVFPFFSSGFPNDLHQELLGGGYRDLALSFCRLRRLAPAKADALAERLEFLTRRLPAKNEVVAKAKAKAKASRVS